jgi:hypothetical protein
VPLEHSSSPSRRWYRPAREPLPDEPGRLVVCALLAQARRARGCTTAGDDRLETRAYALKRYLFRLGHAARAGRYATSIEQLVVGVAPVMGWGSIPTGADRTRFVRAHRKSVQRWLDDLEAARVVAHEPERDDDGRWWRTQIVLLAAPEPAARDLGVAQARARAWTRRARRRRSSRLVAIRRRSGAPAAATRARLARTRRFAAHEARRRACVDWILSVDLTHPFGAPPTSAQSVAAPKRRAKAPTSESAGPTALRSAQALVSAPASADGTDARGRAVLAAAAAERIRTAGIEESERRARRLADLRQRAKVRDRLQRDHAARRVAETLRWPSGHPCPTGRLREAWVAYRHGLDAVVQGGSVTAGAQHAAVGRRARHAIALFEQHAHQRPPGWPATGSAALCALASQGRAATFAGDVARLLILAKQMRAIAEAGDKAWLRRAQVQAERRSVRSASPLPFRRAAGPRLVAPEHRRQAVRDRVLLSGGDPSAWPNAALAAAAVGLPTPSLTGPDPFDELDGRGARAARYRADLPAGRLELAPDWHHVHDEPQGGLIHAMSRDH